MGSPATNQVPTLNSPFSIYRFSAEFRIVFFNEKYKNFNNSLNYRDGLLGLAFPTVVVSNNNLIECSANNLLSPFFRCYQQGWVDNPEFTPLQRALYATSEVYSSTKIEAMKALNWLLKTFSYNFPYYVFPSSFIDTEGKYYFNLIGIRPNLAIHPWISYPQVDCNF